MKKIISFSLFGDDPKYYVGAEKNITINKELLPDWETVIYYLPEKIKIEYINKLEDLGGILIDVSNKIIGDKTPIEFPFFWRFLTFLNEGIHLVRDLDSRMSDREVEYIRRWEQSDCKYFIIRDHPWHAPAPSGLFGINGKDIDFEHHFHDYVKNNNLVWGTDQDILYQYIQNIDSKNIYYCGFDKPESYIPRIDKNFFIGMQLDENDKPTEPSGVTCLNFLNEINL